MKQLVIALLCLSFFKLSAQPVDGVLPVNKLNPPVYIGVGSGLYGKFGLIGAVIGVRVLPETLLELNMGMGGWGNKAGISLSNSSFSKKWLPSVGLTKNFGAKKLPLATQITYQGGTTTIDYSDGLDYNDVNILHLGIQRQWVGKRGNKFVLEMGYSIALNEPNVTISADGIIFYNQFIPKKDITFTNQQNRIFDILSPNGIMLNLSYQFGIGKK